jgi:hypothetical protein
VYGYDSERERKGERERVVKTAREKDLYLQQKRDKRKKERSGKNERQHVNTTGF